MAYLIPDRGLIARRVVGEGCSGRELFDFGADVAIEVLADDDVVDRIGPTSAPGAEGPRPGARARGRATRRGCPN